jgi:hypothetical protein
VCRLGSFLNSAENLSEKNLEVREISTPGMKNSAGMLREQRQFYYTTREVVKGEEALHYFRHSGNWQTGRWIESESFHRPKRNARDLVLELCSRWDSEGKARPNKTKGGGAQCAYCSSTDRAEDQS